MTTLLLGCQEGNTPEIEVPGEEENRAKNFYFGVDLSYVNQILDHGGVYKSEGEVMNPYAIFSERGTN
ncbi:MAG TPA: hypothetical protein VK921_17710, partial [Anditalea sp.]|nr:hypothetical protein [Anditalea sp.]